MHFSGGFGQIIVPPPHLEVGAPLKGNPVSATVKWHISIFLYFLSQENYVQLPLIFTQNPLKDALFTKQYSKSFQIRLSYLPYKTSIFLFPIEIRHQYLLHCISILLTKYKEIKSSKWDREVATKILSNKWYFPWNNIYSKCEHFVFSFG